MDMNMTADTATEAPILDHDGLMALLDYNEQEQAILAETSERMSGLRITYYADKAATQVIRSDVLKTTDLTLPAGDGVCAVVLEGFITFERDGVYTLIFSGASDGLPVGFEGGSILKHNGKYYLTAATYNQSYDANGNLIATYDSMIAVSDNLMGPYSETRLLLRNGGHNNLFVDKEGKVWTTLFAPTGNLGFNCKPALVRLTEDERGILSLESED